MLILIFQLFIALLVVLVLLTLKPLVTIIRYKLQYGDQVYCYYYPLIGFNRQIKKGQLLHGNPYHRVEQLMQERPHITMIVSNLCFRSWIAVVSPEAIQSVMLYNIQQFTQYAPFFLNEITDLGIFTTDGAKWKFQRHHLSQSFHFDKLQEEFSMMRDVVENQLKSLEQNYVTEKPLQILDLGKSVASEVGIRVIFGESMGERQVRGQKFELFVSDIMFKLFDHSRFSQWFLFKLSIFGNQKTLFWLDQEQQQLYAEFEEFQFLTEQIVQDRLQSLIKNPPQITQQSQGIFDMYLNLYMEHLKSPPQIKEHAVTLDEVVHQLLHLQLGAADNSGTTLGFIIYSLAKYPEQTKILKREIEQKIPQLEKFTFNDLKSLDSCYKFIKETMRHYSHPHGTLNTREALEDCFIENILIPKGSLVSIIRKAPDCNPKFYQNPLLFDMDRWDYQGDRNQVHIFTPFSSGPHNCLGQHLALIEFKIFLVVFLKKFSVSLIKQKSLQLKMGLQIQPVDDQLVLLKKLD